MKVHSSRRLARLAFAYVMATISVFGVTVVIAPQSQAYSEQRYVVRVLDGDTVEMAKPGKTSGPVDTVRLVGVNTNEFGMCHWAAATARLTDLVDQKWVTLSADDPGSLAYDGRLLRFVEVDSTDVALTLIQDNLGFAFPSSIESGRNSDYLTASAHAAQSESGIWDDDACGTGPDQGASIRMVVDWDAPDLDEDPAEYSWDHAG